LVEVAFEDAGEGFVVVREEEGARGGRHGGFAVWEIGMADAVDRREVS
jgi:hypothetical protein